MGHEPTRVTPQQEDHNGTYSPPRSASGGGARAGGPSGAGGAPAPPQPSGSRYSLASSMRGGGLTTQQRTALENATVAFFLQCISCHPNNQRLMAQV